MSIKIMSDVWQLSGHKGSGLLLLLAIADAANDWGHAWPGQDTLAQKTRLTTRTVRSLSQDLENSGEIYRLRYKGRHYNYVVLTGCDEQEKADRIAKLHERIGTPEEPSPDTPAEKISGDSGNHLPVTAETDFPRTVKEPPTKHSGAKAQQEKKKRQRKAELDPRGVPINNEHPRWNELWNAIVEVTGVDASIRTNKSNIANVVKEILLSTVEYTGEDVQYAPTWWKERQFPNRVTVNALPKWLQDIRTARLDGNHAQPVRRREDVVT